MTGQSTERRHCQQCGQAFHECGHPRDAMTTTDRDALAEVLKGHAGYLFGGHRFNCLCGFNLGGMYPDDAHHDHLCDVLADRDARIAKEARVTALREAWAVVGNQSPWGVRHAIEALIEEATK